MKCGSTKPVTIFRSASTKRRSSLTTVPLAVLPSKTWSASFLAKWFSTRTVCCTHALADQLFELGTFVGAM